MASRYIKEEETDIFVKVERQIEEYFSFLVKQLNLRKEELLRKLQRMKLKLTENLKTQDKTMKDLENARIQLHDIGHTTNMESTLLQSSLAPIEKQISDLKISIVKPPNISFSCSTQNIADILRKLGNIGSKPISSGIDYSSTNKAINVISVDEIVQYIHIDYTCDHFYLTCGHMVYVFNAKTWEKVNQFAVLLSPLTRDELEDYQLYDDYAESSVIAITTNASFVYVIHKNMYAHLFSNYEPCQFTKREHKLKKYQRNTGGSSNSLDGFSSLISTEDELFVTDSENNRICVFDSDLFYRRQFGTEQLKRPILIEIRGDKLVVLDNYYLLHLFNKLGHYLGNIGAYGNFIVNRTNFCIDKANNLILTDAKQLKIISPKGELVKTLGEREGEEDLSGCGPVVLHGDKLIVACNSINCIKIFKCSS